MATGPHKTLYNRFVRWSRRGVFEHIFAALAGEADVPQRVMIDATHLKAHRTAASLRQKRLLRAASGAAENSKLHAVCDGQGRPVVLLLTEGQMSDHKGAVPILPALPPASESSVTAGMTAIGSVRRWSNAGSRLAYPQRAARKSRSHMTRRSIASATASGIRSAASRTGVALPAATTAVPIPSSRRSASQRPSLFGSVRGVPAPSQR